MHNFTHFLETRRIDPAQVVQAAIKARADEGVAGRAAFGDCKAVSTRLLYLLAEMGVKARLGGGLFGKNRNSIR